MGYQPDANRGTFIAVTLIIGQHTLRQAERQVGIHGVIISIKADALEVFFRKIISIRSVVCQPQGRLHEEPRERMTYGPGSDTHKEQLAPAQLRNQRPSQYIIVQTKRMNTGIGEHSCSCHHKHVAALQPLDRAEPSIELDWNSKKDLSQ